MKRLRIGVWGVGRIGRLHAENVASSAGKAELVGVADPVKPLALSIARRFGVQMYESPDQMLRKERLDGVIIATPTPLHKEHVTLASEAGLPMLLEKPLALKMGEADKIVSIVRRSGVKFQLGFNRRFDPSYWKAKQLVVRGTVGKPLVVKTCARDPNPPPNDYIRQSGGMFVDQCIHDIDIALWLMNSEVTTVRAIGKVLLYPQFRKYHDYDNGVAILEFKNGGLGVIEGSRTSRYGYDLRTEVLGSRGVVSIDNWKNHSTRVWTRRGGIDAPHPWFMIRFAEAYRRELYEFYHYLSKGDKSPVSAEEARTVLRVALAARESAEKGRTVALPN
jgi:scyllo-inositol 2-dehydrogenase (NAD+)